MCLLNILLSALARLYFCDNAYGINRKYSLSSLLQIQGQDYLFVRKFVPFVGSVLVKACKESDDESDMEVILSGLASLNDEISWFKKEAAKWDVQLSAITPLQTNQNYCR